MAYDIFPLTSSAVPLALPASSAAFPLASPATCCAVPSALLTSTPAVEAALSLASTVLWLASAKLAREFMLLTAFVDACNDSIADSAIDSFQTVLSYLNGSLLADDSSCK